MNYSSAVEKLNIVSGQVPYEGRTGKAVRIRRGSATVNGEPADALSHRPENGWEGVGPATTRKPGDLPDLAGRFLFALEGVTCQAILLT